MGSEFSYQYDLTGLYAYRVNILSPQLTDLTTILGVTVLVLAYLALYWKVLPYVHYHRTLIAEARERRRKLGVAQNLILMKEIQSELEAEMKEDLSREAAQKMSGHVSV